MLLVSVGVNIDLEVFWWVPAEEGADYGVGISGWSLVLERR